MITMAEKVSDRVDPMDWLCECGHRYGDHHFLDEDCCIANCLCIQFRGVEVKPDDPASDC